MVALMRPIAILLASKEGRRKIDEYYDALMGIEREQVDPFDALAATGLGMVS